MFQIQCPVLCLEKKKKKKDEEKDAWNKDHELPSLASPLIVIFLCQRLMLFLTIRRESGKVEGEWHQKKKKVGKRDLNLF